MDGERGSEARPAARAAGDGRAGGVGHEKPPGGRRRFGGVLPDAREHLEQGRLRGYPRQAGAPAQVVPRPRSGRKKQRVAQGLPVDDPKSYGEWIADVESPAAQYRGRYQLQLDEAQALLKKAGAKRGGAAGEWTSSIDGSGQPQAGRRARLALAEARKYMGTPYPLGWVNAEDRLRLLRPRPVGLREGRYRGSRASRTSRSWPPNGTKVSRNKLLPGDLVFFRDPTGYVHHVGISLGGDKFLHAPHTGDVVKNVEPEGALLRPAVHRRPPLRPACRRAGRGGRPRRRRAGLPAILRLRRPGWPGQRSTAMPPRCGA